MNEPQHNLKQSIPTATITSNPQIEDHSAHAGHCDCNRRRRRHDGGQRELRCGAGVLDHRVHVDRWQCLNVPTAPIHKPAPPLTFKGRSRWGDL